MNARGIERVPFMELGSFRMGSWCSTRKCGGGILPVLGSWETVACNRTLICDVGGNPTCCNCLNGRALYLRGVAGRVPVLNDPVGIEGPAKVVVGR